MICPALLIHARPLSFRMWCSGATFVRPVCLGGELAGPRRFNVAYLQIFEAVSFSEDTVRAFASLGLVSPPYGVTISLNFLQHFSRLTSRCGGSRNSPSLKLIFLNTYTVWARLPFAGVVCQVKL